MRLALCWAREYTFGSWESENFLIAFGSGWPKISIRKASTPLNLAPSPMLFVSALMVCMVLEGHVQKVELFHSMRFLPMNQKDRIGLVRLLNFVWIHSRHHSK